MLFLMLLAITLSCEKENAFKNPTSVSFDMVLNTQGVGGSDDLRINEDGYIVLSSFTVIGERDQAESFEFQRDFPVGLLLPFGNTTAIPELQFELPQGAYKKITLRFETHQGSGNSLYLLGEYDYTGTSKMAIVQLGFNSSKQFEVDITDLLGSKEITLNEHKAETPQIIFNPKSWFQDVTDAMLYNSTLSSVGNEQFMSIDVNNNVDIFNLVDVNVGGDIKCLLN